MSDRTAFAVGTYRLLAAEPGMTVDGDVLADCIADACPRLISDEGARQIAEDALRGCHGAGMTVLRGPGSRPWTPPEPTP